MRCRPLPPKCRRSGTAVVEFAAVLTFVLVPMMIGLWEMGRVVQVQQIVANSAREGARLAAQANTINSSGNSTQIMASVGPTNTAQIPNVKAAVMQYLSGAGLSQLVWADVQVAFAFTSGNTALTDPYQGVKGQRFAVTVTLNQAALNDKCLWTALGLVKPSSVTYTANWQIMVDDPFSINSNLPTW